MADNKSNDDKLFFSYKIALNDKLSIPDAVFNSMINFHLKAGHEITIVQKEDK